jgi:hypothetical protein
LNSVSARHRTKTAMVYPLKLGDCTPSNNC